MVGVQFVQIGGDSLELGTVGQLDSSFAGYDNKGKFATTMRVWNGNGYTTYGWSGTSGTDVDDDPDYDNKWLDLKAEIIDEDAPAGLGVWVLAANDGVMTIAGEVSSKTTDSISLSEGYNMVANPYPGAVKIADFCKLDSSFAGYDNKGKFATTMRVWNGNGYTTYGWSGTSGTDIDDDPDYDNQWLDQKCEITDAILPFGTAVWINAANDGTATFSAPTSSGN